MLLRVVGGGVYWLTLSAHPGNASLIAHLEPQNLIYLPSVDVLAVYQYTRTHVVLHITGWSVTLLSFPPLPYPLQAAIVGPLFGVCLGTHVKNCTTAQALGFPITFAACPPPPISPLLCVVMCDCMPQYVCVYRCDCVWCLRYHLSLTRPSP